MSFCDISKGFFFIHECKNDASMVCCRCGKNVCKEHGTTKKEETVCTECMYNALYPQYQRSGADSIVDQFFGDLAGADKTGRPEVLKDIELVNNTLTPNTINNVKAELSYSTLLSSIGTAAASGSIALANELFAFESPGAAITNDLQGSRDSNFMDS